MLAALPRVRTPVRLVLAGVDPADPIARAARRGRAAARGGVPAVHPRRAPALRSARPGPPAVADRGALAVAARGDGARQAGDRLGRRRATSTSSRPAATACSCRRSTRPPGPRRSTACSATPTLARPLRRRRRATPPARPSRSSGRSRGPLELYRARARRRRACPGAALGMRLVLTSAHPAGAPRGQGVGLHHRPERDQAGLPGRGQHPLAPAGVRRGRGQRRPLGGRHARAGPRRSAIPRSGSSRPSGT